MQLFPYEKDSKDYEAKRKHLKYYTKSLELIEEIRCRHRCHSIIDIGGWSGGFVGRTNLREKTCLDARRKHEGTPSDVALIIADFLKWKIDNKYDIVTCMQVLEHLADDVVAQFAEKLFQVGPRVLISVPYRWRRGKCRDHHQDPVDKRKLREWTGRDPDLHFIVRDRMFRRLICYYAFSERTSRRSAPSPRRTLWSVIRGNAKT